MSICTYHLDNPRQSNSSAGRLNPTAPAASTSTTGWTVSTTVSNPYSLMSYNAEHPSNFIATALPNGPPLTTAAKFAQDCWRVSDVTSGTFSAGTWYSLMSVIAVTSGGDQDGNARWRIWRSSSESGANATEITAGTMVGTSVTNLSTTVAQTSSASTQIAQVALTNEYLFLQCAWQRTGAGGASNRDVLIRLGPMGSVTAGSGLVTPDFTASGGAAPARSGMLQHYYRTAVQGAV